MARPSPSLLMAWPLVEDFFLRLPLLTQNSSHSMVLSPSLSKLANSSRTSSNFTQIVHVYRTKSTGSTNSTDNKRSTDNKHKVHVAQKGRKPLMYGHWSCQRLTQKGEQLQSTYYVQHPLDEKYFKIFLSKPFTSSFSFPLSVASITKNLKI